MKYASFGTVSHGTLRTEDLLETFADTLENLVQRNAEAWRSDAGRAERERLLGLVYEARKFDFENESVDMDDAEYMVNESLVDALQGFAPPYAYFGSHPGDGSDFGFWLSEEFEEDFDGLKVNDTSEVPANYCGEVLHVSDHGNATLYTANNGELQEVWAIV